MGQSNWHEDSYEAEPQEGIFPDWGWWVAIGFVAVALVCIGSGIWLTSALSRDMPDGPDWTAVILTITTSTPVGQEIATETRSPTQPPAPSATNEIPTSTPTKAANTKTPASYSPELFIQDYYAAINASDYEKSFGWLSNGFKDRNHCCNPDGSYQFQPYVDWWNSVERVDVLSANIETSGTSTATVRAKLIYTMKNGSVIEDEYLFDLVGGVTDDPWFIDWVR